MDLPPLFPSPTTLPHRQWHRAKTANTNSDNRKLLSIGSRHSQYGAPSHPDFEVPDLYTAQSQVWHVNLYLRSSASFTN